MDNGTLNTSVDVDLPNPVNTGYWFIALDLIGCFANGLVLLAIITTKQLQIPANILVASVSVIDGSYATFIHPFITTSKILGYWPLSDAWCKTLATITGFAEGADFWGIFMISLNRYFAVVHPILYHNGVLSSNSTTAVMVFLQYLIPLASLMPIFLVLESDEYVGFVKNWAKCAIRPGELTVLVRDLSNGLNIFLPMGLVVVMHILIVRKIRLNRYKLTDANVSNQGQIQKYKNEVKLTKIAAASIAYYVLSYIPVFVARLLLGYVTIPKLVTDPIIVANRLAWFTNSFFYGMLSKQFREAFKRLLCCSFTTQRQSTNENLGFQSNNGSNNTANTQLTRTTTPVTTNPSDPTDKTDTRAKTSSLEVGHGPGNYVYDGQPRNS